MKKRSINIEEPIIEAFFLRMNFIS